MKKGLRKTSQADGVSLPDRSTGAVFHGHLGGERFSDAIRWPDDAGGSDGE